MDTEEIYDLPRLVSLAEQSALQKARDKYDKELVEQKKRSEQKLLLEDQKLMKYKLNLRKYLHDKIFKDIKNLKKQLVKIAKQGKKRYIIDYVSNRQYFSGWVLTKLTFEKFMELILVEFDAELANHVPFVALYYAEDLSWHFGSIFETAFDQRYKLFIDIEPTPIQS